MMNEQTRNTPCNQLTGTTEPPWHAAMAAKGPSCGGKAPKGGKI